MMNALKAFNAGLTEIYGETVNVAGQQFDTAMALKELDPTAYHLAYQDFLDDVANGYIDDHDDAASALLYSGGLNIEEFFDDDGQLDEDAMLAAAEAALS